jgi:hypothetical protein
LLLQAVGQVGGIERQAAVLVVTELAQELQAVGQVLSLN